MANKIISFEAPEELVLRLEAYIMEYSANRSALIRKAITELLDKKGKK